ncbi:hypothetical protein [Nostoc sp.]|uniref:hypothetical protein n=1 Tax=Nostoc sp. TaxID=1180 RepID=UPI002FF69FEF
MKSDWRKSAPPIEIAQEVLKETEQETAIRFLVDLLQGETSNKDEVAWLLGQINPGDQTAIAFLVNEIQNYADCWIDCWMHRQKLDKLWQIDPSNESIINFLVEIIQTIEAGEMMLAVADSLAKFDPRNEAAVAFLDKEIQDQEDNFFRWLFAYSLGKIDPGNKLAINTITQFLKNLEDELHSYQASLINILKENSIIDLSEFYDNQINVQDKVINHASSD